MREMKKTLSAVLALVMLISLFAFPGGIAFAAENEDELVLLARKKKATLKRQWKSSKLTVNLLKQANFLPSGIW